MFCQGNNTRGDVGWQHDGLLEYFSRRTRGRCFLLDSEII